MKIHFKRNTSKQNLIFGAAWLVLGVSQLFFQERSKWIGIGWLVLATVSFTLYFQQSKTKHILIEGDVLKENWKFGKSIRLSEIITIKEFAGDYILKSENQRLSITKNLIENDALLKLDEKLKSLDVEWV